MNENHYDDIINMPHYEPKHHTRMAPEARAAQFAPFAALTGYDEATLRRPRHTADCRLCRRTLSAVVWTIKFNAY